MKKIRLTEDQVAMILQREKDLAKKKVLKITEGQYKRIFLNENLFERGEINDKKEKKEINPLEFAQELIVFVKDVISRQARPFSAYWVDLGITRAQLFKLLKDNGVFELAVDESLGRDVIKAKKTGFRKAIKSIYRSIADKYNNLSEVDNSDINYISGISDPTDAPNFKRPIRVPEREKVFKLIGFDDDAERLMFLNDSNKRLYAISSYDIPNEKEELNPYSDYDLEEGYSPDADAILHYVNDTYGKQSLESIGTTTEEFGEGYLVRVTRDIANLILDTYPNSQLVQKILGGTELPESTGAASSGAYVGAMSGGPIKKNFNMSPNEVMDDLINDGEEENNPWAICTASVGREDKEKFESCVRQVKAQYGLEEDRALISDVIDPTGVVQFVADKSGEEPFVIDGVKWQYCWVDNNGHRDVGVYRFGQDICYSLDWFQKNILDYKGEVEESTTTVSVGGDSGTFAYDAPAGDGSNFWNAGNKQNKRMSTIKRDMPIQEGFEVKPGQIYMNGNGRAKIEKMNDDGTVSVRTWGTAPAKTIPHLDPMKLSGWKLLSEGKKILKITEAQMKAIVESENLTSTAYPNGDMVDFDDCTKLNNNKVAQNGGCSQGDDGVVKLSKTKGSVVAEAETDTVATETDVKLYKAKVKAKNGNDYWIAYLEGNVFPFKDIIKRHNAKWNSNRKHWYWFLDKNNPQETIDRIVKPALQAVKVAGYISEIDEILKAIKEEQPSQNPEVGISKEDEDNIKRKLNDFKNLLTNIENDEQFKDTMKKLINIKSVQGYEFSFGNSILIFIQNRSAGIVNSKTNWLKLYDRKLKPNARPLLVWAPQFGSGFKKKYNKEESKKIKTDFYKKIKKPLGSELTPKETFDLEKALRGYTFTSRFKLVPVYSQHDTVQIDGTEDKIKKAQDEVKDIPWFEENMISDKVRPVYQGLLAFADNENIPIEYLDDLQGARGVSASGAVKLLKNEGNDVGLTKTLAHELFHEILHQNYIKSRNSKFGKYHIGKNMDKGTIEQQAELSAWMFMYYFGFDVKTTSLNYTIMWGADKDKMVVVFNMVSSAVNKLIDYVSKSMKNVTTEAEGGMGSHVTPEDVAKFLGVEDEYHEALGQMN